MFTLPPDTTHIPILRAAPAPLWRSPHGAPARHRRACRGCLHTTATTWASPTCLAFSQQQPKLVGAQFTVGDRFTQPRYSVLCKHDDYRRMWWPCVECTEILHLCTWDVFMCSQCLPTLQLYAHKRYTHTYTPPNTGSEQPCLGPAYSTSTSAPSQQHTHATSGGIELKQTASNPCLGQYHLDPASRSFVKPHIGGKGSSGG